jgi:hypothetical protein
MELSIEEAAHDQLVAHAEGRSDSHSEADALVHVQLTCGLASYGVNCLLCDHSLHCSYIVGVLGVPCRF